MTACKMNPDVPLCVDLDGTLTYSDTLHESALQQIRARPVAVCAWPFWLMQGKAVLKQRIAANACLDVTILPYNEVFLAWLRQQRAAGRRLVLCTAADYSVAQAVAVHLGVFDEVIASDGTINLAGSNKARALVARFGEKGFDYAGNARPDLKVWQHARRAVVVNADTALIECARAQCEIEQVFAPRVQGVTVWRRVFRFHQWLKNLLLLVPMLAAHQLTDSGDWWRLLLAFLSFSFSASAVYIMNDLLDIESDRHHPRKRYRPFAAASVSVPAGVLLVPFLLAVSGGLGVMVGTAFVQWLLVYLVVTASYSFVLKRLVLIDCLVLAGLYTLRVIAGAAAVGLPLSFWLLAFSVFLFFSLAFVKRFAELLLMHADETGQIRGRGYHREDAPLIGMLGVAAGYASVLVLALYLQSEAVRALYATPEWIWGAVPVLLFWISWLWLQAHRGRMDDDPMVFAIRDRVSLGASAVFCMMLILGTLQW